MKLFIPRGVQGWVVLPAAYQRYPRNRPQGPFANKHNERNVVAAVAAGKSNPSTATTNTTVTFFVPYCKKNISTGFGTQSPLPSPTILQVTEQLCRKLSFFTNQTVETRIVTCEHDEDIMLDSYSFLIHDTVLIVMTDGDDLALPEQSLQVISNILQARLELGETDRKMQLVVDCGKDKPHTSMLSAQQFCGPYQPSSTILQQPLRILPWSKQASAQRLYQDIQKLIQRRNTDDFCLAILLFINQFVVPIDWVKYSIDATWEKGPVRNFMELYQMIQKCGPCITNCVMDTNCRECLSVLTDLDTRDQVASYRTIVSFESSLLRDFSQCILTKHNIFGCEATIPNTHPDVPPVTTWNDIPVTPEIARSFLIGHLEPPTMLAQEVKDYSHKLDVSWKVACGANEAYDKFPCQNQIFYPTKKGTTTMWYDPVFRVETLDGRSVWCHRHYKVRQNLQGSPATFYFSVLDNGVVSNEYWTIVDVADDMTWIVFHYAGAAQAVGQRYLGGLLCTPDGSVPGDPDQLQRIWKAFRSAGIEPWELYVVDNRMDTPGALQAGDPPLTFYRQDQSAILQS